VTVYRGGIARADTATLGIVLLWAARAATRGVRLRFARAPDGLRALARLCDAEPLLGFA
jgi:ABC-type transporter Mla MlaB component